MENDLVIAQKSLRDLAAIQLPNFNPVNEVSTTIVSLLQNISNRFSKEDDFNSHIKEALLVRLPEATWSEMAQFLSQRESNENERLRGILAPFIPKDGDKVPLLELEKRESTTDERLHKGANKETLQAVDVLMKVLATVNKKNTQISNTTSTNDQGINQQ